MNSERNNKGKFKQKFQEKMVVISVRIPEWADIYLNEMPNKSAFIRSAITHAISKLEKNKKK